MDFRKFRVGGELSDILVVIGESQFQLHRFPLYTRSGLFLKEFAKLGTRHTINLDSFPGGIKVFTIIADFCYNISIEITVENVVGIRCGAKYLEMYGSGNLYEKTGVFIEGILHNGKRGKDLEKMLQLLSSMSQYSAEETAKHSQEQCITALIQYWNKNQYGSTATEEVSNRTIQSIFFAMDFDFFVNLMQTCQERLKNTDILSILVSEYIRHLIEGEPHDHNGSETAEEIEVTKSEDDSVVHDLAEAAGTEHHHTLPNGTNHHPPSIQNDVKISEESLEKIKLLLDSIKPNLMLTKYATVKWLKPLLQAYSSVDSSAQILGSIAASMANQMDADCISMMTEQILTSFAEKIETDSLATELKELLVKRLVEMAEQELMNAESFIILMEKLDLQKLSCHDDLLYITAQLNSKGKGLDESLLKQCLSTVDMKLCTAKALRQAQTVGNIPAHIILEAALNLCEYLQERVDASSKILQEQEKEISNLSLQTFGMTKSDTSVLSPQRKYRSRNVSTASLYSLPTSDIVIGGSTKNGGDGVVTPRTGGGQGIDGMWSEHSKYSSAYPDTNSKLCDLLSKQRQGKLWNK